METGTDVSLKKESIQHFLSSNKITIPEGLEEKLWVNYTRITLVNKNIPERVTLDLNLEFLNESRQKKISDIVVAEVKQDRKMKSVFMELMRQKQMREGGVSKYCLGVIHLFEDLKYNNFKPKLLSLNKISHDANPFTM